MHLRGYYQPTSYQRHIFLSSLAMIYSYRPCARHITQKPKRTKNIVPSQVLTTSQSFCICSPKRDHGVCTQNSFSKFFSEFHIVSLWIPWSVYAFTYIHIHTQTLSQTLYSAFIYIRQVPVGHKYLLIMKMTLSKLKTLVFVIRDKTFSPWHEILV